MFSELLYFYDPLSASLMWTLWCFLSFYVPNFYDAFWVSTIPDCPFGFSKFVLQFRCMIWEINITIWQMLLNKTYIMERKFKWRWKVISWIFVVVCGLLLGNNSVWIFYYLLLYILLLDLHLSKGECWDRYYQF
jgi:hypothetical protein